MRNKIQAPGKQVLHKQVPKAQALQKEKDPRLVAVGGFGQVVTHSFIIAKRCCIVNSYVLTQNLCNQKQALRIL